MRHVSISCLLIGLAALVPQSARAQQAAEGQAQTSASAEAPAATSDADEQAARQVTRNLVEALNAANTEKVVALFYEGAELIDDAGNVHKGTAAIKDLLDRFYERFPGATSEMTPDSLWMVGPALAIEEGKRVVSTKDEVSSAATYYTIVLIKQEGQWKIASAREVSDDSLLTPHDHLQPLAWLVG
ncbi:MAG: YybH family protein, partial [Planctomycetota bacterium]